MRLPGDSAVTTKINGVDAKPVRVAPSASTSRRQEQAIDKPAEPVDVGSNVQLTGAARSLAAIEQSLFSLPAVDEKRVAEVKRRFESGEYRVDPQRIADKLLNLESDLQRRSPLDRELLK
jgi:negative regulator of flagellin synthesis FlgM